MFQQLWISSRLPAKHAAWQRHLLRWMWVAVLGAGVACTDALNWREVLVGDGSLAVSMPCKPNQQERKVALGGETLTMRLWQCDAGGISWSVSEARLSDPAHVRPALAQWQAAIRNNLDAAADSPTEPYRRPGMTEHPEGVLQSGQGRRPDGRALYWRAGVLVQALRVYQLVALSPTPIKTKNDVFANFFEQAKAQGVGANP